MKGHIEILNGLTFDEIDPRYYSNKPLKVVRCKQEAYGDLGQRLVI